MIYDSVKLNQLECLNDKKEVKKQMPRHYRANVTGIYALSHALDGIIQFVA